MLRARYPARERWRALPRDASRDEFFRVLSEAVTEFYLADPENPYQQSGRSSGAARWEETRRVIAAAVHRSGDFMDVGCANGLLLQSLIEWTRPRGITIQPHGLDLVPELIELARRRFPGSDTNFIAANALYWAPSRQYDFVRTNLEYVPEDDWTTFVRRQYSAVAPGGRLILCHYRNADDPRVDLTCFARDIGYAVSGAGEAPGVALVWIDRPA